ncbi:MAG: heavy-metal-associated domain-containing protein [Flavobacteriales bacterium]
MRSLAVLIVSVAMLFSCNSTTEKSTSNSSNLASIELSIEGMSCEQMCGSAVCKGLEKIDGVASTDLEFSSDNPIDKVTVQFDPNKVTAEEMTSKVEGLAGGAYKVKSVK